MIYCRAYKEVCTNSLVSLVLFQDPARKLGLSKLDTTVVVVKARSLIGCLDLKVVQNHYRIISRNSKWVDTLLAPIFLHYNLGPENLLNLIFDFGGQSGRNRLDFDSANLI